MSFSEVRWFAYEADQHCPAHAYERFGEALDDPDTEDSDGNPIHACFEWDDCEDPTYCVDCAAEGIMGQWEEEG